MAKAARKHLLILAAVFSVFAMTLGMQGAVAQSDVDDPAQLGAGRVVFESNCSGCHGVDGTGSATGRNLIGIAEQEPDRSVHITSVTEGKGNMPAWGPQLSEEEIDAAVSYVRLTFVAQEPDAELAVTGSTTMPLAIIGLSMLLSGTLIYVLLGRRDDMGLAP